MFSSLGFAYGFKVAPSSKIAAGAAVATPNPSTGLPCPTPDARWADAEIFREVSG